MSQLFEQFSPTSKEDWVNLLNKELKGADFDSLLIKKDSIEGLEYPSFFHRDDSKTPAEVPGKYPFKRAFSAEQNDWTIVGEVLVSDEKKANAKALDLLMKGNTALNFEFESQTPELNLLFQNIEFQYIKVYFSNINEDLIAKIKHYFETHPYSEIFFNYNPLAERKELLSSDLTETNTEISHCFNVDAYSIQQGGANCTQEIAFALSLGHEYLAQQLALGKNSDDALASMHFTFGIGSNYLFEIAKLRAFRLLWAKISKEYGSHESIQITSKTGFVNKSLKDPYTNLLRQTTEVMSAVLGGANNIINQAYDKASTSGSSELAERMATNISLILKEESYLEKVLDAVGGSYAIESLTESLAGKAWELFQGIESQGDLFASDFSEKIKETAAKRIALYQDKKLTLIGINKFPNPDTSKLEWRENNNTYFGLKQVIIENEQN